MKNKISEILAIGIAKALVKRRGNPVSEVIKTVLFIDEINEQISDNARYDELFEFLLYLNKKGLINNHDFNYGIESSMFIKQKNMSAKIVNLKTKYMDSTSVQTNEENVIVDLSDNYRNIKTKENYMSLLKSGMFWEFHPELTGDWDLDEPVINK